MYILIYYYIITITTLLLHYHDMYDIIHSLCTSIYRYVVAQLYNIYLYL